MATCVLGGVVKNKQNPSWAEESDYLTMAIP